jgi:cell wall-associated serine proteinase prtA
MYIRKLQEFKGFINSVEFDDKGTFYSTEFALRKIEEKFGEVYNDDFVKDLKEAIDVYTMKVEDFCAAHMEREFVNAIEKVYSFEEILFKERIISNYLNHKIMDGSYLK